jgi:alkylation response protein AidB-like acyl-CoA dehydrogenase
MDFSFSRETEDLRQEIRQFIKDYPPEEFPVQAADDFWGNGAYSYEYTRKMGEAGWLSLTWPKEWGGRGRTIIDKMVVAEELAYCRAPSAFNLMLDGMSNHIISHGNDYLREEILPKIAEGSIVFWLALSEPNAGSDLLALQTKAEDRGDVFVVNGQKIWSSRAHLSDYGYLITRTDPNVPRHRGLSMFIVDRKLPGITVEPIINLVGENYHNHVYFDNVEIPKEFLLGKKNEGFFQMLKGLEMDRFWARYQKPAVCKRVLDDLIDYCKNNSRNGRPLYQDTVIRQKLAQTAIEIETCRLAYYRMAWMLDQKIPIRHETALGKTFADEMGQRLMDLGLEIFGLDGQLEEGSKSAPFKGLIEKWYLVCRGHTIAGGTVEVMKDTVARMGLGLSKKG